MKPLRGLLFCIPLVLTAQFSPGELSKFHADLEGTTNCVQCHEIGKKSLSDGCILCHSPLKKRIDAGKGYHKDKKKDCGSCHSDHNSREFELVYWPKNINDFNHDETGYKLEGKHRSLKCAECHTRKFITWEPIIAWAKEHTRFPVLDRTFLGLDQSCKSCHKDVHRGEVSRTCSDCHNPTDWKSPIQTFDHRKARFQLTGAHIKVECVRCHLPKKKQAQEVWKLTGLRFDTCTACHEDEHKGSFGQNCESCHNTTDWKKELKAFDHSKTKYPLEGKHVNVKCADCHQPQLAGGLPKFDTCLACHEDKHFGQFTARRDGGDCAACHTVKGFKPTIFTIVMHQSGRFKLEGSHLAVPCSECHKVYQPVKNVKAVRFTWRDPVCSLCHEDVHRGQFKLHFRNRCEKCHNASAFTAVNFDHAQSKFPLDGKHRNVACDKCHRKEMDRVSTFTRYRPVPHRCVDCHTLTGDIR